MLLWHEFSSVWRFCISASSVRECTDVSYVPGERVELTVHKESVTASEIKEVERRSRRAQFIYDRNYNRNSVMHLADFRWTVSQSRKVRVFVRKGIRENISSYPQYTFCRLLAENTHSFAWNGDQQREDTFISLKKRTFAHISDSITIFAF